MSIKLEFRGRSNMKKYEIMFAVLPTVGLLTALYNHRNEYTIGFVWLFFQLDIILRYE